MQIIGYRRNIDGSGEREVSLQIIEAYIPENIFRQIEKDIQQFEHVSYWKGNTSPDHVQIRLLIDSMKTEEVLNYFERSSMNHQGMEVLLFPVEAYISEKGRHKKESTDKKASLERASRQELYSNMGASSKVSIGYIIFVVISAIVVAIGLIKDSPSIVIGGMVIAPLLGPVIGVAFASILGDFKLLRRALLSVVIGIVLAAFIAIVLGRCFGIPVNSHEFISRTSVSISDMVLALASGIAGAVSTMRKFPSALVGVMVAVALLPPVAVMGMSGAAFLWPQALQAMLLLLINISSILLSAVIVFSITGIRPINYEEIQIANNSRKFSLIFVGMIVLLLLGAVIYVNKSF